MKYEFILNVIRSISILKRSVRLDSALIDLVRSIRARMKKAVKKNCIYFTKDVVLLRKTELKFKKPENTIRTNVSGILNK